MKKIYKMAVISFALAFAACDDSTAASENGDDDSNVACTDEPVDCPSIFVENASTTAATATGTRSQNSAHRHG